ncbi:MAG: tetratricopeptide repeat protein [Candidatus Omnitrophota bacterium]
MKKTYFLTKTVIFLTVIYVTGVSLSYAASAGREIKEANKFYQEGEYDKALEKYDEALEKKPDDSAIEYNRALTLYRKGLFNDAVNAFSKVLSSGDEKMEENLTYNAANSKYRNAEMLGKTDPGSAKKGYEESLEFYKRAMELNPSDSDAKYNYEFTLKRIEEMKQQQQDEDKQEEKEEEKDNKDKDKQEEKGKKDQEKQEDQKKQEKEEKKDKQDEQDEQDEQKDQQKQDKEKEEEQKKDREKDKQEKQDQQDKKPDAKPKSGEEKQPQNADDESDEEGKMSQQEAEILLMAQEEEEERMRLEIKKKRRAQRPTVLKDW